MTSLTCQSQVNASTWHFVLHFSWLLLHWQTGCFVPPPLSCRRNADESETLKMSFKLQVDRIMQQLFIPLCIRYIIFLHSERTHAYVCVKGHLRVYPLTFLSTFSRQTPFESCSFFSFHTSLHNPQTQAACKYFSVLWHLLPTTKVSTMRRGRKTKRELFFSLFSLSLLFRSHTCSTGTRLAFCLIILANWETAWNFEVYLNSQEDVFQQRDGTCRDCRRERVWVLLFCSLSLHLQCIGSILHCSEQRILCAVQKNVLQCPREALRRFAPSPIQLCWCEPVSLFQLLDWNEAFC